MADLSVTSAPKKDIDLFISHNTKDNSHTVYSTRFKKWRNPLGGHTAACGYIPQAPQGLHDHTLRSRCYNASLTEWLRTFP